MGSSPANQIVRCLVSGAINHSVWPVETKTTEYMDDSISRYQWKPLFSPLQQIRHAKVLG